jgi:hypothetical protein
LVPRWKDRCSQEYKNQLNLQIDFETKAKTIVLKSKDFLIFNNEVFFKSEDF